MNVEEFRNIQRLLVGAFGVCRDDTETNVWYAQLKGYAAEDVKQAINNYISIENRRPTIADINTRVQDVIRWKKQRPDLYADPNAKTYKCPVCRDLGFVEFEGFDGRPLSRPCDKCEKGAKTKYQWSPEGMAEWIKAENAKGRHPGKPVVAPREIAMRLNYGVEF